MRVRISFLVLLFLCASFAFAYQEMKNLSLSAEGIEQLEIDCGAGFLKVQGIEDLKQIEVSAEIIVKGLSERREQKFIQKNITLTLKKRGGRAVLVSKIKSSTSFFSLREKIINLTVNLPKNIDLNVDDGSGWMRIENITGRLHIDDGSGEMHIEKIEGNVEIDDGSGDIDVRDISGDISIDDGSGAIYVKSIGGNVTLSDSSGSINVDGVDKDVEIRDDGSGSVRIKNVKGKVIK